MALLKIIHCFNHGIDYAGKPIKPAPQTIYPFTVTNSYSKNRATLKRRMIQKIENGAIGLISQPVFSIEDALDLIKIFNDAKSEFSDHRHNAEITIGFFPLSRLKTAQFIASHVPGIKVPDSWISALFEANKISEQKELEIGFELSAKLFKELRKANLPVHIMSANHFELVKRLINS